MLSLTLVFAALCLSVEAAKAAVAGKVEASRNFCVCVSCQAHARSVASPMPEELVLQVGPWACQFNEPSRIGTRGCLLLSCSIFLRHAHAATARGVVESPGRWILSHTRFTVLLTTVCYNQWRKQPWLTAQRHADRRQLRQLGMHPCVLSQAVANPHSNSVAPNRAALAQHQQCGLWLSRKHQFFAIFCEIDLATVWRIFSRAHLQEVLRACQFFQPEKRQSFVPGSVFTRDHTLPNCYTSQLLDDAGGWHDDVVDMTVCVLTMAIVRNSEVF